MKKFNTITVAVLSTKYIQRTPFIVEKILPKGLTILGGLGKVGKSWFSFWLVMQVAKGEPIWNFKTTKAQHYIWLSRTTKNDCKTDFLC